MATCCRRCWCFNTVFSSWKNESWGICWFHQFLYHSLTICTLVARSVPVSWCILDQSNCNKRRRSICTVACLGHHYAHRTCSSGTYQRRGSTDPIHHRVIDCDIYPTDSLASGVCAIIRRVFRWGISQSRNTWGTLTPMYILFLFNYFVFDLFTIHKWVFAVFHYDQHVVEEVVIPT